MARVGPQRHRKQTKQNTAVTTAKRIQVSVKKKGLTKIARTNSDFTARHQTRDLQIWIFSYANNCPVNTTHRTDRMHIFLLEFFHNSKKEKGKPLTYII